MYVRHQGTARAGDPSDSGDPSDPSDRCTPSDSCAPSDSCDPWTQREFGPVRMSVLRLRTQPSPAAELAPVGRGAWPLALVSDGPLALGGHGGEVGSGDGDACGRGTRLEPGDLVLWEPSRPFDATAVPEREPGRAIVLHLPRSAVPVPDRALRSLVARPMPSDEGPAALLARFVEGLADQATPLSSPQAARLGAAAVSLSAVYLTGAADLAGAADRADRSDPPHTEDSSHAKHPAGPPYPREAGTLPPRTAALLRDIRTFIDRHLGDPALTPAVVASAHHISVRYLHHLFHCAGRADGRTVGGYVREQRLAHCRTDLADPALAALSVSRISARWGFPDGAVFGRAFKKAYGVAPGEYRRRSAEDGGQPYPYGGL